MIRIRNPQDFAAGLLFIVIGAGALFLMADLRTGTARSMGPAYVPNMVAGSMALIGAVLAFKALTVKGPSLERWSLGLLTVICGAVVIFGLLLSKTGLLIASMVIVLIASFAMPGAKWRQVLPFAVIMAGAAALLFIVLLNLPMPLWPRW